MKKLILFILIIAGLFALNKVHAQVKVNVNINVDAQPGWGPSGYDRVDYYYLPDVEAYYYVPRHQFIYFNSGRWIFTASLPERCRNYDLYRGYKVVINEPSPYLHHDIYRTRYSHYRGYYDHQPPIHDHRNKHAYADYDEGNGHGNGHAYGHYKGHKDKKGEDD